MRESERERDRARESERARESTVCDVTLYRRLFLILRSVSKITYGTAPLFYSILFYSLIYIMVSYENSGRESEREHAQERD